MVDLHFEESMPKLAPIKRQRITLKYKKQVIDRYINFLGTVQEIDEDTLYDPNDVVDDRCEKSIRMFLKLQKKTMQPHEEELEMSNIFKWVKAFERGEFQEWGGINDLDRPNCRSRQIIAHINKLLQTKHPYEAQWHKLVKSPSSRDQYGMVARTLIPAGTLLGFFKGDVIKLEEDEKMKGSHKYLISPDTYIEGAEFDSCYARYYNSSTQVTKQNVCVERLPDWKNPQRAVCFVANTEIAAGHELIIAFDQGYVRNNNKRYKTVHSQFAANVIQMAAAFPSDDEVKKI